MNKPTESGTTLTAPNAPVEAQDTKVMVLAIHRGPDDQIVITPIDVEHEDDDLTEMAEAELKARKILDGIFVAKQQEMTEALAALYEIYDHRLYRNQFATFENFCFAMYGTNRINDVLLKKARKKKAELAAELKEEHEGTF
jgi:hypothetical protein